MDMGQRAGTCSLGAGGGAVFLHHWCFFLSIFSPLYSPTLETTMMERHCQPSNLAALKNQVPEVVLFVFTSH